MAFDGVVTRAIAMELDQATSGGKIEKIYQPEPDELVLFLHTDHGKRHLYLSCASSHPGIYLTEETYANPPQPSSFCMLMRKHLSGGRIHSVHQKDGERIVEVDVEVRNELGDRIILRLVVEIMGKHSNIILMDTGDGHIIDAIKRISFDVSRVRQILPGGRYEYPPDQGKTPFDVMLSDAPYSLSRMEGDPDALLARVQGLSPLLSRELAPDPVGRMTALLDRLERGDLLPRVYQKPTSPDHREGAIVDFHIIPIAEYEDRYRVLSFDTVSEAVSYYYSHREASNRIRQKSADLSRSVNALLKKAGVKKQRLGEDLIRAGQADRYQRYGELLTANLHRISAGADKVIVHDYYDDVEREIPLDPQKSPADNAQQYFRKYNKAKTARREKQKQLSETEEEIRYLESVATFIDGAEDVSTIDAIRQELTEAGILRATRTAVKKKKVTPTFLEYKSPDGFRILAGRNNRENDLLTFRTAGRNDLWFHTKDIPGSHVILFTDGREVSDDAIFVAASIAAYHSKGRSSENVPVDYTRVRHVKKPNGARPGMCIFTDNHTVYATPRLP